MTTVKVHGREMTFSEEELKTILESYFAPTPQEGRWFEVNPLTIDQDLFDFERKDKDQEETRQIILDAFVEVKNNQKYNHSFLTFIPAKDWISKTYNDFETLAANYGGHVANWVEQALEWAQRIANGESWESVCNEPDKSNWYRFVKGKNGDTWLVGSSQAIEPDFPATDVLIRCKDLNLKEFYMEVPLIVKYK